MNVTAKALAVIKKLRESRGYTLQEVADGIEYKTGKGYLDIESGKTKLRLEHLEMLSKFYNVPISIFFETDITDKVIKKGA